MTDLTNFVQVIKACEAASGPGAKQTILTALRAADEVAQRLISEALNPYRVFGVKKFDRPVRYSVVDADPSSVFQVLDRLAARELTGNAARAAVTNLLAQFTPGTAQYIERVIEKDLQAGFTAETVNKVFSGLVPTFSVMLAERCEDTDDLEQRVTFPCLAEFKYDGERTIALVRGGEVTYYSRSGKEATHVSGLFDADLLAIRRHLGHDFVLDGERCSARGFIDAVNAKKNGNDEAKANLRLRAFFLMPLTDWLKQSTTITARENYARLADVLAAVRPTKVLLPEGREVKDLQDMVTLCAEAIDVHGQEGLMLKSWDSPYQWDRTFAWVKVKRFYDVDARIVGFYPGRPRSRLEGTIGGVHCVAYLESGERVEFNVGSGFSDEDRADMKANPEKWLRGVHVIKYQEVSRAKGKPVASLRFCAYVRTRDDKEVEV